MSESVFESAPPRRRKSAKKKAPAAKRGPAVKKAVRTKSRKAATPPPLERIPTVALWEKDTRQARSFLLDVRDALEDAGLDEAAQWLTGALEHVGMAEDELAKLPEDYEPPAGGAPLGEHSQVELVDSLNGPLSLYRRALTDAAGDVNPRATVIERLGGGQKYLLAAEATGTQFVCDRSDFRVVKRVAEVAVAVPVPVPAYEQPGSQLDVEIEAQRKAAEQSEPDHEAHAHAEAHEDQAA